MRCGRGSKPITCVGCSASAELNSNSSTRLARRENTLKLTPPGQIVAPKGEAWPDCDAAAAPAADVALTSFAPREKQADIARHAARKIQDPRTQMEALRLQLALPTHVHFRRLAAQR